MIIATERLLFTRNYSTERERSWNTSGAGPVGRSLVLLLVHQGVMKAAEEERLEGIDEVVAVEVEHVVVVRVYLRRGKRGGR